jgi:DNA modification methylase
MGGRVFTYKDGCGKCGARRIDRQLGNEPSPDCNTQGQLQCGRCYVCNTISWAREVRCVLRDDGVFWLNLGDSYNGSGGSGGAGKQDTNRVGKPGNRSGSPTLAQGNLVGIPWRVALALQADGWVLRQELPWTKRSPMPESVKNRPAKALEHVFMFTKRMGYFYDNEAVKRQVANPNNLSRTAENGMGNSKLSNSKRFGTPTPISGRNFWNADLWFDSVDAPHGLTGVGDELVGLDVTTTGYPGAHFATFPEKLIDPLILAGTSEKGCCVECGAPWKRVVEKGEYTKVHMPSARKFAAISPHAHDGVSSIMSMVGGGHVPTTTVGWQPTCDCNTETVPCTVLDPFIGSGTTCAVAIANGRRSIGIDLSERYLRENAVPRACDALVKYGYIKVIVRPPQSVETLE